MGNESIVVRGVSKVFETPAGSFRALTNVSIELKASEFVAIVGKSGSGKSTLINLLTGIDRPTIGEISVAGETVTGKTEAELARWRGRNVGIVFQFFQLLPTLTIAENIMLPMDLCGTYSSGRRERAIELLSRVGISEQADKFPAALSGGQQQRAAIARALANDPPLLVADEPTGNLDSKTSSEVMDLFRSLAGRGITVVIVTHERDIAKIADRTIKLRDGHVESDTLAKHPEPAE
ncbi:ABC transporter ATP-binding protein [Devosia sp. 66-22]|uniref:ABC transporter ATP-binding protein n=1 Tax=Devosia sp. 66-22 TaxID=1895753 RepID=UPI000928414B|nr:ABC transporter ATP-binding protein [Devosia sp. 66-22]OJX46591.1 MAG: ABC transporter ATP-binding protein [Devosia sp. 66-22]